ncbi:MAG: MFS transporter [Thermoanaerobaculia bacterium]|nr:MFS transporter [Thermoanaerobaculia bacterium]
MRGNQYWRLLRDNRDYRYLWLGQLVSLLGDWFNLIASAALVSSLTSSGLALGSLFAIRMLAPFLVSPLAGVLADRYNRTRILIGTDVIRGVAVLGFLLVREPSHVWLLYTLTAIQLGLSGFFFPARSAILPDLVREEEIGTANIIGSVTWSSMLAGGAALGGIVAGVWGNEIAFIADAATFGLSAVLVAFVRYRPPARPQRSEGFADSLARSAIHEYLDGLRYLGHHAHVLVISLHKAASALLVTGMQIVQVAIAEDAFVIGANGSVGLGLMYGIAGVGTGLGPIVARMWTGDRHRALSWAMVWAYLISIVGLAVAATMHSFGVVLLGVFLRGLGGGTVWVFSTQLLLEVVPERVRGRVFATEFALFSLLSAVGLWLTGATLDAGAGLSEAMLWMAVLMAGPALLWTLWLRGSRSGPRADATAA